MGFFNCCSLVGHSTLGTVFFGTEGVAGGFGCFGGSVPLTGGASGGAISRSNLEAS